MYEVYDWVKSQTKQDENMGVYLNDHSSEAKLMVSYVGKLASGSRIRGGKSLQDCNGALVGHLAPDTLVRSFTQVDLHAFDGALKGLERFVKPELIAPIARLRAKL